MTEQPNAPQQASKSTLATSAVRAHITVALRNLVDENDITVVDGGDSIYVRTYGRMIEITTKDITDQM